MRRSPASRDGFEGVCRLCLEFGPLRRSHVVPNAFFRRIKQRDAGRVVQFDDSKDGDVQQTNESWWEHLLCEDCEGRLGRLDKYGVETLERARKAIRRRSDGVVVKPVDHALLKGFFAALLWRAAISTRKEFHQVKIQSAYAEALRKSLLEGQTLPPRLFACRLAVLFDPTPAGRGGFSADNLGEIIPSPRSRTTSGKASFLFVLDGFLVELFAPDPPHKVSRGLGMLKNETQLYIPPWSIFDVPELKQLLVIGFGKYVEGKVSPNIRTRH